jgi:hypothetical protein
MADRRARKHRRAAKAILKYGPTARPAHKSRSGRTGSIRTSQLKGQRKPASDNQGVEKRCPWPDCPHGEKCVHAR